MEIVIGHMDIFCHILIVYIFQNMFFHIAYCLLYELHGLGRIGRADGVRIKAALTQELEQMQARERKWIVAETVLKIVRRSDCPAAKALLREMEKTMGEAAP